MEFKAGRTYRVLNWEDLKYIGNYNPQYGWIEFEGINALFLDEMRMICGERITPTKNCKEFIIQNDGEKFFIRPIMCEDITEEEPKDRQLCKTIEVFHIPQDMIGCAYCVEHGGMREPMLLHHGTNDRLVFTTVEGKEFVCMFLDYKVGNITITPMIVSEYSL